METGILEGPETNLSLAASRGLGSQCHSIGLGIGGQARWAATAPVMRYWLRLSCGHPERVLSERSETNGDEGPAFEALVAASSSSFDKLRTPQNNPSDIAT